MPLVALQDRFGDLFWVTQCSLMAPRDKAADRHATRADRVLGVSRYPHPFKVCVHIGGERQLIQWIDSHYLGELWLRPRRFAGFYALTLTRHGYCTPAATTDSGGYDVLDVVSSRDAILPFFFGKTREVA